jgi:hypothetical protein
MFTVAPVGNAEDRLQAGLYCRPSRFRVGPRCIAATQDFSGHAAARPYR